MSATPRLPRTPVTRPTCPFARFSVLVYGLAATVGDLRPASECGGSVQAELDDGNQRQRADEQRQVILNCICRNSP